MKDCGHYSSYRTKQGEEGGGEEEGKEREKEMRASFSFGLNFVSFFFLSLDHVCMYVYVCLDVMLYPHIDRAQAYIYE